MIPLAVTTKAAYPAYEQKPGTAGTIALTDIPVRLWETLGKREIVGS